jgi:hypothetical protein
MILFCFRLFRCTVLGLWHPEAKRPGITRDLGEIRVDFGRLEVIIERGPLPSLQPTT